MGAGKANRACGWPASKDDGKGGEAKRRKKKWLNGKRPKLHQGGVLNEGQKPGIDDVKPKVERVGKGATARLVNKDAPYNLRGRQP